MRNLLLVTLTPFLLAAFLVGMPTATAQAAGLTGTVLDQDGRPVADAEVRIYQYWGGDGGMSCDEAAEPEKSCAEPVEGYAEPVQGYEARARTDSAGAFAVAVHDGRLQLQVNKEGYAGHWQDLDIDGSAHIDIEMLRYPEKTARIVGQVTGGGQPLAAVSVSVENPEYGIYECSVRGDGEVPRPAETTKGSTGSGTVAGSSTGSGTMASSGSPSPTSSDSGGDTEAQAESPERVESTVVSPEPYPDHQCAIEVDADGSFSGNVTPGYTTLRFHHESWRGDGPQFYPQTRILDLPADGTTRIDVDLVPRPGPDARLSGYVVDGSTDAAIPGVQVSFSNQDAYGWANAWTDADGSYRVALRSGYTSVHVWADGYFPWEGQVQVGAGDDRAFDIVLTPGESRYGGCCITYAEGGGVRSLEADDADGASAGPTSASSSTSSGTASQSGDAASEGGTSEGATFEDLGGGLGPYDPASRDTDGGFGTPGEGAPALPLVFAVIVLAAVAGRRRG